MPIKNLRQSVRSATRRLLNPVAAVLVAVCGIPAAHAVNLPLPGSLHTLTLTWDTHPFAEIQSYRIVIGLESQQYLQEFDAGLATSYPIEYLEYGRTYYFAIKAIGTNGLESSLSQELAVTIAPPPLPLDGRMLVNQGSGGPPALRWSYPQSNAGSVSEFVVYASRDLVNWTKYDTIDSTESVSANSQTLEYALPIVTGESNLFFRVTARNWLSESVNN